jgi:hypothetical protein
MVSGRVMGRSCVMEPLYPTSLFGMKIISELDHIRGAWDFLRTLLKRSARISLILTFWIWGIVKDDGPGSLSLPSKVLCVIKYTPFDYTSTFVI